MGSRSRLNSASLFLLLFLQVAELALYQIAVPSTLPPDPTQSPPIWHRLMMYGGLFCFYFASTLAIATLLGQMIHQVRRGDLYARWARNSLAVTCGTCAAYALISIFSQPSEHVQFWLESTYTLAVVALVVAQFTSPGDSAAKVGIALLAVPFLIHYYGPFSVQFVSGEEALWQGLPEQIQDLGQWALVLAAWAAPLCFAPRPRLQTIMRPGPLGVSVFVGLLGLVVLSSNYEVGMRMASEGLGIELGPAAPMDRIAVYLFALVTGTWTLMACLTAESEARRRIGVGIGLVFASGYGFQWPVQFVAGLVGLVAIGEGARDVGAEEGEEHAPTRFRAPPIDGETWQCYVQALLESLKASGTEPSPSAVTVRGDDGRTRTHLTAHLREVPIQLTIEREAEAIILIQVQCGQEPLWGEEPVWTLHARPDRKLAGGAHPGPPRASAPAHKSGDGPFDERFRVRDRGGWTECLFDEGMRARAAALLDGWLAFWQAKGLVYRVHPGRGAPLDNPIPISELAFRGSRVPASVDRLNTLLNFLVAVAEHGLSRR
jgi:hypothetical protein